MPFAATLMDLEIIILSEVRQIPYDIIYMWNLLKKKKKRMYLPNRNELTDTENKLTVSKGMGRGRNKLEPWNEYIYTTIHKILMDNQQGSTV